MMHISEKEVNMLRQWFNCISDTCPNYHTKIDLEFGKMLHEVIGIDVPTSLEEKLNKAIQRRRP